MRRRYNKFKEEGKYEDYNKKIKEMMKVVQVKHTLDLQKLSTKKRDKIINEERKKEEKE